MSESRRSQSSARPPAAPRGWRRWLGAVARWIAGAGASEEASEIGARPAEAAARERFYRHAAKSLFPGKRILVLEDNDDCRETLRDVLLRWGFDARCAGGARAALGMIGRDRFDFAVLDYTLPDGCGDDVARAIRASQGPDEVKLVALTGNSYLADRSLYHAVLEKPLSPHALREAMVDLLSDAREPLEVVRA